MSRLEIVHLRSAGEPIEFLSDQIRESIWADGKRAEVVTLYRREGLDTDIAVHIHHPETPGREEPNWFGLKLAYALRDYGLVQHTVWEEMT